MTVEELIDQLQQFPKDARVLKDHPIDGLIDANKAELISAAPETNPIRFCDFRYAKDSDFDSFQAIVLGY